MKQEPPLDARCRDKFLVQSVTITGDKEFTNVTQIVGPSVRIYRCDTNWVLQWDSVEKSAIQEKKIRVSWLPPLDEGRLESLATPVRRSLANGVCGSPSVSFY